MLKGDDNDIEQKNIFACKILGDQMALLELRNNNNKDKGYNNNYANNNNDETSSKMLSFYKDDINKGKMKFGQGYKSTLPFNDNEKKKLLKLKNSSIEFDNSINSSNNKTNRKSFMKNSNNQTNKNPNQYSEPYTYNSLRNSKMPYNNQNIYDNKLENNDNIKTQNYIDESISNDLPEIEVIEMEKIDPEELEQSRINPFEFENRIITKSGKHTIYERAIKNLKKKETKIQKERNIIINKKLSNLRKIPKMNKRSIEIMIKKGEYIPIENRAAQIHSQNLTQIILNEELNKIEKENKENQKFEGKIYKKYEEREWNEFVEKCFKWKDEVYYKRKAAEMLFAKNLNSNPQINQNSKKIMKKMMKGNNSVDDVFTRLYKDFEEHNERQKNLEEKNMPSFFPKINNKFYKNNKKNKKNRNNSYDGSYERFVTDNNKNNFFLESQIAYNNGKIKKMNKKVNKFINKGNNKYKKTEENISDNKYYKPMTTINNNSSYVNTEANINKNKYMKYMTTDNNMMTTETNLYTNKNNLLTTDVNAVDDNNNIIDQINENSTSKKQKNNNYFDSISEDEDIINYNNNNENNAEKKSDNDSNIEEKNDINNKSEINEIINEENILKELNDAKIKNEERMKNESNEERKNDNSLYKINIMETTQNDINYNVIVPSNKFQNFFDIEEINEL